MKKIIILLGVFLLIFSGVLYAQETVKIVHFSPHTGASASYGYYMTESAELAVKEINAAGGVMLPDGKRVEIEYIVIDETSTVSGAVAAVRKGISLNPLVMLGPNQSGPTLASEKLWGDAKIPTITDATSTETTKQGNPYTFRMQISTDFWVPILVNTAIKNYGVKRPAVIYSMNDYSDSNYKSLLKTLEELDVELITTEKFQVEDNDFTGQLVSIKNAEPDALFLFAYTTNAGRILRQINELDMGDIRVLTERIGTVPAVREVSGEKGYKGTVTSTTWCTGEPDPNKKIFYWKYRKEYSDVKTVSPTHMNHYDSVYIIKDIVERVGLDREKMREELANLDYKGALGHYIADNEGNFVHEMYAQVYTGNDNFEILRKETYPPLSDSTKGYIYDAGVWVEEK